MSTVLAVSQIIKGIMVTTQGDQFSEVGWYYRVTAIGGSPATDADFAVNLDALVAPIIKARMATTSQYNGILAAIVWPSPIPVSVGFVGGAGPGTNGAICQDRQSSGLTTWQTALAKQANRGRTYWPFPSATDNQANGIPTGAYTTAIQSLATALIGFTAVANAGRTATVEMGVYHRATHTTTKIVSALTRVKWATQRRRGSYGRTGVSPI